MRALLNWLEMIDGAMGKAVSKNPEMLKTTMDTLSSMPEEAQSSVATRDSSVAL